MVPSAFGTITWPPPFAMLSQISNFPSDGFMETIGEPFVKNKFQVLPPSKKIESCWSASVFPPRFTTLLQAADESPFEPDTNNQLLKTPGLLLDTAIFFKPSSVAA